MGDETPNGFSYQKLYGILASCRSSLNRSFWEDLYFFSKKKLYTHHNALHHMGSANYYSLLKQILSEVETRCLQSPGRMIQNSGYRLKIYHATFPEHYHAYRVILQNSSFLMPTFFLFRFPFSPWWIKHQIFLHGRNYEQYLNLCIGKCKAVKVTGTV